jgi:hypothetical protein
MLAIPAYWAIILSLLLKAGGVFQHSSMKTHRFLNTGLSSPETLLKTHSE